MGLRDDSQWQPWSSEAYKVLCSCSPVGSWGPHLIIVPTSVMLNWEMEIKRWCPSFKILTYYGAQKERKLKRQVRGVDLCSRS